MNTGERDKKSGSPISVLIDPDSKGIDSLNVQALTENAIGIIDHYLPQWRPREATTMVVWNTEAQTGCYLGKWKQRHHILITLSAPELSDEDKKTAAVLTIAHELFHQRVAEIKKVDDPNGVGIDRLMRHEMVQKMSDYQQANIVFGSGGKASLLQKSINEGCAVYAETQLHQAILEDPTDSPRQKNVVRHLINQRIREIKGKQNDTSDTYSVGYRLVSNLLNVFRDKSLEEILTKIDWQACGRIQNQSTEFRNIINNPINIPGLE